MIAKAKQQGIAIQFATFIGLLGSTPAITLSAPTKMSKFDQFLRLIRIPLVKNLVCYLGLREEVFRHNGIRGSSGARTCLHIGRVRLVSLLGVEEVGSNLAYSG